MKIENRREYLCFESECIVMIVLVLHGIQEEVIPTKLMSLGVAVAVVVMEVVVVIYVRPNYYSL